MLLSDLLSDLLSERFIHDLEECVAISGDEEARYFGSLFWSSVVCSAVEALKQTETLMRIFVVCVEDANQSECLMVLLRC